LSIHGDIVGQGSAWVGPEKAAYGNNNDTENQNGKEAVSNCKQNKQAIGNERK
jgi:hypothetical protein